MNLIEIVAGADGLVLVAIISSPLFVEELGVPLPFAPGDLVLAAGGMALAAGVVHPVVLIGAVLAAVLIGGMLGREIFSLLGQAAVNRVADRLHLRKPFDRAAGLLRRGGWRAVFVGRLIPGMRVHTNEVAGIIGVPRRTYFLGLVTSAVGYVAALVSLGALAGPQVMRIVVGAEHQVLIAAGIGVLAGLFALGLRWLHRRDLWPGIPAFVPSYSDTHYA